MVNDGNLQQPALQPVHQRMPGGVIIGIAIGAITVFCLGILLGFFLRGALVPTPYANEQSVLPTAPEASQSSLPSPTSVLPTPAWQTFTDGILAVRYPGNWVTRPNPAIAIAGERAIVLLTDGKGYHVIGNGSPELYPSRFVGVTSLDSSLSPKAYVDAIVEGFDASVRGEIVTMMNRRHYSPTMNMQAEVYNEPGEGGRGTIVLVSNGKKLYFFNLSAAYPTDDADINQIVASLSFH